MLVRLNPVELAVLRLCATWRTLGELQEAIDVSAASVAGAVTFLKISGRLEELPRLHGQPFYERTPSGLHALHQGEVQQRLPGVSQ